MAIISTPKEICLHRATNDLPRINDEEILSKATEIHTICRQRGVKIIWSGITPWSEDPSINEKGNLLMRGLVIPWREKKKGFSLGTERIGMASTNRCMKMTSTSINKDRVHCLLTRDTSRQYNVNIDRGNRYRHNH